MVHHQGDYYYPRGCHMQIIKTVLCGYRGGSPVSIDVVFMVCFVSGVGNDDDRGCVGASGSAAGIKVKPINL